MAFSVTNIVDTARDLYNGTGDTFFTDSMIYNWMTQACNILAREAWLIEATTTAAAVSGTGDYSYPTDAIAIKRITYNGGKLSKITLREYDAMTLSGTTATTTGTPNFYTDFNSTVSLFPVPDNTHTIKYWIYKLQPTITVATTLSIPEMFKMDLVDYILMHMYSKDKDFGAAEFYAAQWARKVAHAIKYTQDKKKTDRFAMVQSEELLPSTIIGAQ